jgi:hypothetical protein
VYHELNITNPKLLKRIKCMRFKMKGADDSEELRFEKYTQFLFSEVYGIVIVLNHNKGEYRNMHLYGSLSKAAQESSPLIELSEIIPEAAEGQTMEEEEDAYTLLINYTTCVYQSGLLMLWPTEFKMKEAIACKLLSV